MTNLAIKVGEAGARQPSGNKTSCPVLRPGDLKKIKEENIQIESGVIVIEDATKNDGEDRIVRILDRHSMIIRSMQSNYPGLPGDKFFRHPGGSSSVSQGKPFSANYLYVQWKKACAVLGVEGVDMYGGTRHSTVTAIAIEVGEAGAIQASGHKTSKTFRRYCQTQGEPALEMAKLMDAKRNNTA